LVVKMGILTLLLSAAGRLWRRLAGKAPSGLS
jgi:hypothetical protein